MFVRYQTPRGMGLFQFASNLRWLRRVSRRDRRLAVALLNWFNHRLPPPPESVYTPPPGVHVTTWFRLEQRNYVERALLLASLASKYVARMRQARLSRLPGEVVFEDQWQVVIWTDDPPDAPAYPLPPPKPKWDGDRATIRRMKWSEPFDWPPA